jgi:hypothetical protein
MASRSSRNEGMQTAGQAGEPFPSLPCGYLRQRKLEGA